MLYCLVHTVYHESFEAEKFYGFRAFMHNRDTFYMKVQDGTESMRDSTKVLNDCTANSNRCSIVTRCGHVKLKFLGTLSH